jgi:hypothetical protein
LRASFRLVAADFDQGLSRLRTELLFRRKVYDNPLDCVIVREGRIGVVSTKFKFEFCRRDPHQSSQTSNSPRHGAILREIAYAGMDFPPRWKKKNQKNEYAGKKRECNSMK